MAASLLLLAVAFVVASQPLLSRSIPSGQSVTADRPLLLPLPSCAGPGLPSPFRSISPPFHIKLKSPLLTWSGGGCGCSGFSSAAPLRCYFVCQGFDSQMGTSSGADFHHHQQQQPTPQGLPPPLRPNGRAPTLQTSLSLGGAASSEQVGLPPDTQEPLSNSNGGHDSATESASSRETWPGEPGKSGGGGPPVAAALITALRIADNKEKEVVGNGAAELRSCFMFSSTTSETFSGHIAHKPMLVL